MYLPQWNGFCKKYVKVRPKTSLIMDSKYCYMHCTFHSSWFHQQYMFTHYKTDPGSRAVQHVLCGRFIAWVVGSNPAENMYVRFLSLLCRKRPLRRADHPSRDNFQACVCVFYLWTSTTGGWGLGLFWSVAPHTTKGIFSCAELDLAGSILKTRLQVLILSHLPFGVTFKILTYSTRSV